MPSLSFSDDGCLPFDFRSAAFCADAHALVRATGRSLETCRQELFIASGDMALAYELLTAGYRTDAVAPTLH